MRGQDGANRRNTRRSIINESIILFALTTNYNTKSAVQGWKNDRSQISIRWNLMEESPPFDLKGSFARYHGISMSNHPSKTTIKQR
jgi:hypothetical protein